MGGGGAGLNYTEEEARRLMKRANWHRGMVVTEDTKPQQPAPIEIKDRYKNNWERQYAIHLEQLRHLKQIQDWQYENIGFRIGEDCFHYPDFFITFRDHFEIHDIKGHKRQNWVTKVKACKERYPFFRWAYVKKEKGNWVVRYI